MKFYTIIAFLSLSHVISAQNDLKIGTWRTHFPYRTGVSVASTENAVYWATGLSVLKMSKADLSIEKLDKLNSLNDVGTRLVRYNPSAKTLIVTYENNNIDLVKTEGGATINLPDIKNNINIAGDKTIYNAIFSGDTAFLACGFGISRLNLRRGEFLSTTFTKLKTYSIALFEGKIWAATEGGIFYVENDPQLNILDFRIWKKMDITRGFPATYSSKAISVFDGKLYFDVNDTLKVLSQNRPLSITNENGFFLAFLNANTQHLLVGWQDKADNQGKINIYDKTGNSRTIQAVCINRPTDVTEDAEGRIWVGDRYNGYRFLEKASNQQCTKVEFDSPYSQLSSAIAATDTAVWVAFGGINGINPRGNGDGFTTLTKDGKWLNFNGFNPQYGTTQDVNCVAIHPKDGRVFMGSFNNGLFEMTGNKINKIYNETNSTVQRATQDMGRQRVTGLGFDSKNNLWVANNLAPNPLIVLKSDGKWAKMRALPSDNVFQLLVDGAGYKWLLVKGSQSGMMVFDEGKDIDNAADDRIREFTNGNLPKELQNATLNCFVTDLQGAIWVGTSSGIAVFECGNDPFRPACGGRLIISSLGNISEYLLREKNVNVIAIDGANRKWFGTSSGLFVTSADGKTEILKFNTENSPLPSNNITAIGIRPNGEVIIGTDRGLMSYRSDATEGSLLNKPANEIIAFPNPVRPDYQGVIAVKGFARDANVKIINAYGEAVYETKALGGQAIWDGKDLNGRRVSTGIYLVLATNTRNLDAPEAVVAKILVMGQE